MNERKKMKLLESRVGQERFPEHSVTFACSEPYRDAENFAREVMAKMRMKHVLVCVHDNLALD